MNAPTPGSPNLAVPTANARSAVELPPGAHPGRILRERFLAPLGLRIGQFSTLTRIPVRRLGQMIRGERRVDAESALRFARYFGTTDDFWMRLQTDHDLREARRVAGERIQREIKPRALAKTGG